MPIITIKRRTGASTYDELYPKTTPAQVDGLLVNGKIAQTYLPSYIFGGLKFLGTQSLATSTSLSTIFGGILGFSTSADDVAQKIGSYYVVSTGGELTSITPTIGSSAGYQLESTGEEGDTSSPYVLEAGDWIVFRGEDRSGSGGTLLLTYRFDIINNTYADATTAVKGVVTLSNNTGGSATIAATGSAVVTNDVISSLGGTTSTKFAIGNHTHTGFQTESATLTSISSAGAALNSGFLIKTTADTFSIDTNTYLNASTSSTQTGYFGNIALRDDTNPSHYLTLTAASDLTAARTFTLTTGDANRTLNMGGDIQTAGNFTVSTGALTVTAQSGGSSITLPTSLSIGTIAQNDILYGSSANTVGSIASTTIGRNLLQIPNITAVSFAQFNADETISLLEAAAFRTAIGAGTSSTTGTVTSVATDGLALTGGPITTTGTITHSTADGYKHVPANSTTNGGRFLVASGTAGTYSWEANTRLLYQDTAAASYDGDIVFEF